MFCIKNAMMEEIEKTLSGEIDVCLFAAGTSVKLAFFHFIEMTLIDLEEHGLMNKAIFTGFDTWT